MKEAEEPTACCPKIDLRYHLHAPCPSLAFDERECANRGIMRRKCPGGAFSSFLLAVLASPYAGSRSEVDLFRSIVSGEM